MLRARIFAVVLFASLGSAPAFADVIAPDVAACQSGSAGSVCTVDGAKGSCQVSRCSRLDYSQGVPPRVAESDCLKCIPGTGEKAPAPEKAGEKAGEKPPEPAKVEAPKASSCAAAPASEDARGLGLGWVVVLAGALWFRRRQG